MRGLRVERLQRLIRRLDGGLLDSSAGEQRTLIRPHRPARSSMASEGEAELEVVRRVVERASEYVAAVNALHEDLEMLELSEVVSLTLMYIDIDSVDDGNLWSDFRLDPEASRAFISEVERGGGRLYRSGRTGYFYHIYRQGGGSYGVRRLSREEVAEWIIRALEEGRGMGYVA